MLEHQIDSANQSLTVHTPNAFNINCYSQILEICNQHQDSILALRLNFADTDYIDSTGIGLILELRSKLAQRQAKLILTSVKPQVKNLLEATNITALVQVES